VCQAAGPVFEDVRSKGDGEEFTENDNIEAETGQVSKRCFV
jgi:hypothetical protein